MDHRIIFVGIVLFLLLLLFFNPLEQFYPVSVDNFSNGCLCRNLFDHCTHQCDIQTRNLERISDQKSCMAICQSVEGACIDRCNRD